MVSPKALLGLTAVAGVIHAFPLRSNEDIIHSQSHESVPRSPNPRFKNPFDVTDFLRGVDQKIPDNNDIQHWVKEAQDKGAIAANGDFDGDGDDEDDNYDDDDDEDEEDDDDDHEHDHDHDKDIDDDEEDKKDGQNEKEKNKHNNENTTKEPTLSPDIPLPQPTSIENVPIVESNTPVVGKNAETQVTTVYVPVPIDVFPTLFPSFDEDEASTSAPMGFPPPSPTSITDTPAETPLLFEDMDWRL